VHRRVGVADVAEKRHEAVEDRLMRAGHPRAKASFDMQFYTVLEEFSIGYEQKFKSRQNI
jgi:hypothetical protein